MDPAEIDKKMRSSELFRPLRILPGAWPVIRVDGRSFRRFTEGRFAKPFDEGFRELMVDTARTLLTELQGIYAYTMSDEISLLLPSSWALFDRRVEKAVSVSAGIASAAFTAGAKERAHFDSRIWMGTEVAAVTEYFRWRQAEAARNALHSWCYWSLRKEGSSVREATGSLKGRSASFQKNILRRRGIDFEDLPLWQRRGVGLSLEEYEKAGYDPKRGRATVAARRRPRVELELPAEAEYDLYLRRIIEAYVKWPSNRAISG